MFEGYANFFEELKKKKCGNDNPLRVMLQTCKKKKKSQEYSKSFTSFIITKICNNNFFGLVCLSPKNGGDIKWRRQIILSTKLTTALQQPRRLEFPIINIKFVTYDTIKDKRNEHEQNASRKGMYHLFFLSALLHAP